jgi:hypothetical protein
VRYNLQIFKFSNQELNERVKASPNPSEGGRTPSLSGRAGEGLSNLQIKN